MNSRFCDCKQCKKARRKGKVLGSRIVGYFSQGVFGWGSVSDYVFHPKFVRGRRPTAPFNPKAEV